MLSLKLGQEGILRPLKADNKIESEETLNLLEK
jgi:hypothetical protein